HIPVPNKLWSAMTMLGTASLDREVAGRTNTPVDAVLLPNLGFVGRLSAPYALILHDLSFLIEPRWFSPKTQLWHRAVGATQLIRGAARLFAVSETSARDAERVLAIPRDRIETFHPGIPNLNSVTPIPSPESPVPTPFILAFGEPNPRKNVATAIAAVAKLREEPEFTDLHLIIVGPTPRVQFPVPSPPASLREALRAGSQQNWITRLSHLSDPELTDLYGHASALLYPSWYEGFGLPLHEAARHGTPCLASAHGALPETAPRGTLFIPPAKPHLWAAALRDVLRSPDLYQTTFDPADEQPRVEGLLDWIRSMSAGV
ncbi:MAG TPA: glycosyltransferase family 1 protein, partial [Candidatus Methylomirabilis sp.]|nr:glycosyltransferase family 1 protein [Candidatus Methylomirabilis sp.]